MLTSKQKEMISGAMTPKFMATTSDKEDVNLIFINSVEFYKEILIFSDLFLWKTAQNLKNNKNITVLVIDERLRYFTVEGVFQGFEESGELVNHLNKTEFTRYNAYTGIRRAGKIAITKVSPLQRMALPWFLFKFLQSRLAFTEKDVVKFPGNVAARYSSLMSIKAVSYIDNDGSLHVGPLPAFKAAGDYLVSPVNLPPGKKYAANVITPDVVSFQLKGTTEKRKLKVEEIYAAGPPVAGKLIYSA